MAPPRSTLSASNLENLSSTMDCKEDGVPEGEYEYIRSPFVNESYPKASWHTDLMVRFHYFVMSVFAVFAEWLGIFGVLKTFYPLERPEMKDFAPLKSLIELIYIHNVYRIATDVVNRPIAGVPAVIMKLKDRISHDYGWTYQYTGSFTDVINVGSYNYLGFSHNDGACAQRAVELLDKYGHFSSGIRNEFVQFDCLRTVERELADFVGTEDAVCCPMGFGTNSMNIPALADENTLILSDALNHASLVLGLRLSKATVVVFRHNDARSCESKLRQAFAEFVHERKRKPSKVIIVVEGIYSMEGTICDLPSFIEVKKRNKAYLFVDEAHSIGALGPHGRGVVDYFDCDPKDVDILMGTLTKSFAAAGGYIAGSKKLIAHLRANSAVCNYGTTMSPAVIGQVLQSTQIISGADGTALGKEKVTRLLRNTRYFRKCVQQLGFLTYGQDDSPVVPLMTFFTTKVVAIGREALEHKIGLVAVGFPATPINEARARVCLSADHTKEQLDEVLRVLDYLGDRVQCKYGKNPFPPGHVVQY